MFRLRDSNTVLEPWDVSAEWEGNDEKSTSRLWNAFSRTESVSIRKSIEENTYPMIFQFYRGIFFREWGFPVKIGRLGGSCEQPWICMENLTLEKYIQRRNLNFME